VRQPGCDKNPGITQLRPLSKESLRDRTQAGGSLGKLMIERRSHSLEMIEGKRREEDEDQVDTSESLRNLQQEIESLLAPLTPLPDLEQDLVPKVGPAGRSDNAGEGAEQESRTGSFEMVKQEQEEEEDWSLVQIIATAKKVRGEGEKESPKGRGGEGEDKMIQEKSAKEPGVIQKDGIESNTERVEQLKAKSDLEESDGTGLKKNHEDNDEEVESSDTEPEDAVEEAEKREGNFKKENEEDIHAVKESAVENEEKDGDGGSWTVRLDKEIKDLENSAIASSKYLSHGLGLEDSLKNIENSLKSTQSRIAGYSRGEAGREVEMKEGESQEEKEKPESESALMSDVGKEHKKRREGTPPHIAVALKGAASMREEAKRRERHYNPRVADALDKMEAMGYTDNDGWLTQLLVMKHGNIGEVDIYEDDEDDDGDQPHQIVKHIN